MDDTNDDRVITEQPYLLMTLAVVGILGCVVLVVGVFVAQALVPDYDWVADTISDLAAGEWEIVMDVSLYVFAAGLFAVSLAAAHAHLGRTGWSIGVFSFAFLAALVVIVGSRNEYGDGDNEGVVIHIYLVYGIGALFALAPLCMARTIGARSAWAGRALIGLTVVWVILCPVFLLSPTWIDGVLERMLGVIACAIVLTVCVFFFQRGNAARKQGRPAKLVATAMPVDARETGGLLPTDHGQRPK